MTDTDDSARTEGGNRHWHALIIGIDRYPAFPAKQLFGCVNDAEAMRRFLVDKVQVPEANIRCLTSPREPAAGAGGIPATAANIRAAFQALAQPGGVAAADHVVLFYAGHGIRLGRSTSGGAKDRYYGLVAEDVAKDPAGGYTNLILGSEIHALLSSVEAQGATATVIADTCHSGASTRAVDTDVLERCLEVEPLSEAQWEIFTTHHPALQHAAASLSRGVGDIVGPFGAYPGGDFVMLTGCLDSETSKEDVAVLVGDDGQEKRVKHGLLTLALLKELEGVAPEKVASLRWMDFYERLRSSVAQRAVDIKSTSQTPSLEGRREKPVFGGAWRPFAPGFTVRKAGDGTLTVDGGEVQGLERNAVIAIYPPDTSDFHNAATSGVEAVIEAATPMTSTARLSDATASIVDLSRARIVRPSPLTRPIVVRLAPGAEPMPQAMRDVVTSHPDGAQFCVLVEETGEETTPAHAELRRWKGDVPKEVWPSPEPWVGARDGWIVVRTDRFGAESVDKNDSPTTDDIVAYLPDGGASIERIAADKTAVVLGAALARGLSAYGRYLRARDRRAVDNTLSSTLEVKLRAGQGAYPQGHQAIEALAPLEPKDGLYYVAEKQWIWVEIRVVRKTALRLQLGWVAFSDDGNVVPIWPPQGTQLTLSSGDVMHVGLDREQALTLSRRGDQNQSLWTLKVIACTGAKEAPALNIASLEQKSVQEEFAAELESAVGIESRGTLGAAMPVGDKDEKPAWYSWDLRVAVTRSGS